MWFCSNADNFKETVNLQQIVSKSPTFYVFSAVAYPGIFFDGWGQQIQLRTKDRENGDLGAEAP